MPPPTDVDVVDLSADSPRPVKRVRFPGPDQQQQHPVSSAEVDLTVVPSPDGGARAGRLLTGTVPHQAAHGTMAATVGRHVGWRDMSSLHPPPHGRATDDALPEGQATSLSRARTFKPPSARFRVRVGAPANPAQQAANSQQGSTLMCVDMTETASTSQPALVERVDSMPPPMGRPPLPSLAERAQTLAAPWRRQFWEAGGPPLLPFGSPRAASAAAAESRAAEAAAAAAGAPSLAAQQTRSCAAAAEGAAARRGTQLLAQLPRPRRSGYLRIEGDSGVSSAQRIAGGGDAEAYADRELARRLQAEEDERLARETARRMEEEDHQSVRMRLEAWEAMEMATRMAELDDDDHPGSGPGPSWRRRRNARGGGAVGPPGAGAGSVEVAAAAAAAASSSRWGAMAMSGLLPYPMHMGMFRPGRGGHDDDEDDGPGGGPPRRGGGYGGRFQHVRDMVMGAARAGLPASLLLSDRDFTPEDYELLCRLDETVENRKGAASNDIEALPDEVVRSAPRQSDGTPAACSICLEAIQPGDTLKTLPCKHAYHAACVSQWLTHKATCPVCQRSIKG